MKSRGVVWLTSAFISSLCLRLLDRSNLITSLNLDSCVQTRNSIVKLLTNFFSMSAVSRWHHVYICLTESPDDILIPGYCTSSCLFYIWINWFETTPFEKWMILFIGQDLYTKSIPVLQSLDLRGHVLIVRIFLWAVIPIILRDWCWYQVSIN